VITISAFPAVMLLEPYVENLARMLTECIDEAVCHQSNRPTEAAPCEDQHASMS